MKISVAMTTWRGKAYLEAQLRSLAEQTRPPQQVVICDDCSGDGTAELCRDFIRRQGLSGWQVVENEENLGYIRNFRKAVSLCEGDVIFLCDQDDVWHPEKLQRMAEALDENPRIRVLASGYRLIDGGGAPLPPQKPLYATGKKGVSRVRLKGVLYENRFQGCACACRAELARQWLSVPCPELPHDWALNLLAYEQTGLYYVNQPLLDYRLHGSNTLGFSEEGSRAQRLEREAALLAQAALLPLQPKTRRTLEGLSAFCSRRARFLTEKKLSVWLGGLLRPGFGYYYKQYCKDLALVLLGKS